MPNSTLEPNLANTAIKLWGGSAESLQQIGDSGNHVYSFLESGGKRYLRLTSSSDRTRAQIEAELDFIAYLHQGGIDVVLPMSSKAGRLIEEIPVTSSSMLACVFNEAQGERFRYDSPRLNRDHFTLRGGVLGRIHALSRTYVPSGSVHRFAWDEESLLLEADKFLPKSETIIWREYHAIRGRLRDYPKSNQTYGLIHGDFGDTNYRHQYDRLSIFDFDDCCYHWFVYDLAITIYPHGRREEGLQLLDWLLEGYSESMPLDVTLADITMFCQWRLIYMFLVYAKKWGFEHPSEQQAEWFAKKRENISRGYRWYG